MKFIGFNPWKMTILKSIIDDKEPMVQSYVDELNKSEFNYFIGVTEAELENPEHPFEELNIVLKDDVSFSEVPNILRKEIDNEELIDAFMTVF